MIKLESEVRKMKRYFYTDGSSRGNPGPGGYGAVELDENEATVIYWYSTDYSCSVTNNEMELSAILHVAKIAEQNPDDEFIIYTDSMYCVNTINTWMQNWASNGWLTSKNKPIENYEIIHKLWELFNKPFFNVEVKKVSGHSGIIGNELADILANHKIEQFKTMLKNKSINLLDNNGDIVKL